MRTHRIHRPARDTYGSAVDLVLRVVHEKNGMDPKRDVQIVPSRTFASGFVGLAAPAKTPASIIAYLNRELNDVVQSPQFRSRMEVLGMTVPAENTPELLVEYLRRETKRQGELAALTGITMTKPK